ncbi:MAG: hypothetical protein VB027_05890 [Gordonibacter sp.]|nr:hypothetical protein [Gordonibacter sp.]
MRRALVAVVVLGVLLVIVLVIDAVVERNRPSVLKEARNAFSTLPVRDGPSEEVLSLGQNLGLYGRSLILADPTASGTSSNGESLLPEGFTDEVLAIEQYRDVRVGAGGSVVGFSLQTESAEAFDVLGRSLLERGWTVVPSGSGSSGSFVKEEGRFNWLHIACVQVGDTTSVVVQCVKN